MQHFGPINPFKTENPIRGTLANSDDPYEISHNATLNKGHRRKKYNFLNYLVTPHYIHRPILTLLYVHVALWNIPLV